MLHQIRVLFQNCSYFTPWEKTDYHNGRLFEKISLVYVVMRVFTAQVNAMVKYMFGNIMN